MILTNIKESLRTEKDQERANFIGQMVTYMKENEKVV